MNRPRLADFPSALGRTARAIGERLKANGHEAWIVGGAVRDLSLGLEPKDVDLATDATPDRIEALFEATLAVGRAFGTIIVRWEGVDCEVTTFRSESTYSDARHPDAVTYSTSAEEDAVRRDFTCNALYLDPCTDEFLDPTQGYEDLEARRLRCVGDPRERFREDALRILRLARFTAHPHLVPTPETVEAARELAPNLTRISAERRWKELTTILGRPEAIRGLAVLRDVEAWVPAFGELDREPEPQLARFHERIALFRGEPGFDGLTGLAALFGDLEGEVRVPNPDCLRLKASREELRGVVDVAKTLQQLEAVNEAYTAGTSVSLTRLFGLFRSEHFERAYALACARARAKKEPLGWLKALRKQFDETSQEDLWPEPWIQSADLAARGVEPGPQWGAILEEAEALQLGKCFADRAAALEWLELRIQDGGKSPRKKNDTG